VLLIQPKKKKIASLERTSSHIHVTLFLQTATNTPANLKFDYLSYPQMVADPLLTAEFVQALPLFVVSAINCSVDDIIVVSITSSETSLTKRDSSTGGVIVALSIPSESVSNLQDQIRSPNSALFSPSNGQLAKLIDTTYPVQQNYAVTSSTSSPVIDPNNQGVNSGPNVTNSPGLSKGAIVGIAVGGSTVLYAGLTVAVVRAYRRRKQRQLEENREQGLMIAQSISAPMMQEPANSNYQW
jgi:hypothetical protein